LAWLARPGHHLLALADPAYPAQLREISDPPPLLFVIGDPARLATPQVAVIGSRNPSLGGREQAESLARGLAAAGVTVTSGLALGIDGAAHRGALVGGGYTVAVAGTGPDRIYPAHHHDLAREIVARGAVVTEFPTGTPPRPEHFPRRNRIISGLSLGVVVVEAALRSGSRITARHAADQGREVFAVPGSVRNPLARGCHALLRDGAKLVETVEDILEELDSGFLRAPAPAPGGVAPGPDPDATQCRVLEALGHDPAPVDRLVERTGLTADAVSAILLTLELRGLVASAPGGCYERTGTGP
jgi:DNA processing protein